MVRPARLILIAMLAALALTVQPASARQGWKARALPAAVIINAIQCVSTGLNGVGGGAYASISGNGRYIIFESYAGDLLPGQVEDSWDVFARDLNAQSLERISVRSDGTPVYNPGDYTSPPAVSSSGRFVAFMSRSAGLVLNDSNGMPDIFLRDRDPAVHTTLLVTVGLSGQPANGPSFTPAVSDDGRYVAFQSMASNLVAGDTNEAMDVFIRDMQARTTRRISVSKTGSQGSEIMEYGFPSVSISGGGRYVAFSYQYIPVENQPTLLGPSVYLYDQQSAATRWISYGSMPTLSNDGRRLLFVTSEILAANDRNNSADVYLFDQAAKAFERISVPHTGDETVLQDTYTPADISDDGRFVVFETNGAMVRDIGPGLSNIYLRDRQAGTTMLVSRAIDGGPANDESHNPSISGDGRVVAFNSAASNLILNDGNNASDTFAFTSTTPGLFFGQRLYFFPRIYR